MLRSIADANFCKAVRARNVNAYHILGRESDRETTKIVFKYLYDACSEVVAHETSKYKLTDDYRKRIIEGQQPAAVVRSFVSGFKLGFACAVAQRIDDEREAGVKRLQAAPQAETTALMRLDQLTLQLEDYTKTQFPKLTSGRTTHAKNHAGYRAGKQYGTGIGINARKRLQ